MTKSVEPTLSLRPSTSPPWKTNFFPIDERDIHLRKLDYRLPPLLFKGCSWNYLNDAGELQADVHDVIVTNSLSSFPFLSSPVFVFHSGPCILTRHVTWRKKNTTSVLSNFVSQISSLLVLGTRTSNLIINRDDIQWRMIYLVCFLYVSEYRHHHRCLCCHLLYCSIPSK
jgi:hypothetical protein